MKKFQSILFISTGLTDETETLKQALSFARNNQAALRALIVSPEFPDKLSAYRANYEQMLKGMFQSSLNAARDLIKVSETDVPVEVEVESGSTPAVRIVRHVLRNSHDLLIKEVEPEGGVKGFAALDMNLLRKCPCPVWLCRPIARHRDEMRVAVAIDPQGVSPASDDLSIHLLQVARALADTCSGELEIISCWEHEFEHFLRHNVWSNVAESELAKAVALAQSEHRAALDRLIGRAGVSGKSNILHLCGQPATMIPKVVEDINVDILVMGTVSRTGISGFIIGNTAENVVRKLTCSLIAFKPAGFVSPVRAY